MAMVKSASTAHFKSVITNLMKERGLNQQLFADLVGVRQSQVSNWMSGKCLPSYSIIQILKNKLGLDTNTLFE